MIPYGRQNINQADLDAVIHVLQSDFLTQGPVVPKFEAAVAAISGAKHAVAVNSATSALHIAVSALGLSESDLLWTSPVTFVASANCARYVGADIDFVDIAPDTFNMCPVALDAKLKLAKAAGRLPKIIVPVHMCGQSSAAAEIAALARSYGVKIVEDASHAIGGHYMGQPVGSCQHSDITVFSFHPVKIVTSAEGGMALTNDPDLAASMGLLRSHGITRDENLMTRPSDGPWYYEMVTLGWNYRMTEMQAALGLSQLDRLAEFVAARNRVADRYDALLADVPLDLPARQLQTQSSFHLYIIRLQDTHVARKRAIFTALRDHGIGVNLHYMPVHMQPYYRALGFDDGDFPVAEDFYPRAISIPVFPDLTAAQQDHICDTLKTLLA